MLKEGLFFSPCSKLFARCLLVEEVCPELWGCLVCVSQRKAFTDLINLENYIEQGGGEGWWGKDYELNFISHDSSPALSLPLSHSHSLSLKLWNSCHTCMKHIRGQAQSSSTSTNIYCYACPLLRREKELCNRDGYAKDCKNILAMHFLRMEFSSFFCRNFSNNRINTIPDGTFNNLHALKKM